MWVFILKLWGFFLTSEIMLLCGLSLVVIRSLVRIITNVKEYCCVDVDLTEIACLFLSLPNISVEGLRVKKAAQCQRSCNVDL